MSQPHSHFVVHVGTVTVQLDDTPVAAREILVPAGATPAEDFVLEALNRPKGAAIAQFNADDAVDLEAADRKFFRCVPRGGGRS